MAQFLIAAFALSLLLLICAAWILRFSTNSHRIQDADVYRDQLTTLEKDKARGVITGLEYDALRVEIARRLLSVAESGAPTGRQSVSPFVAISVVVAAIVGGMALYPWVGAPGLADQPMAQRLAQAAENRANLPAQADLDREHPDLKIPNLPADIDDQMALLRQAAQDRPDDITTYAFLSAWESRVGNFPAAHKAQKHVIELKGDQANASDWGLYSELLIIAADEQISVEAENALRETLRLDQQAGLARYRLGLLNAQTGRPDLTVRIWNALLLDGPESAPYIPAIRANIDLIAAQAGIQRYEQPAPVGPTVEDIEAAEGLSDEDRIAMIEGMVAGLADRLANDGGTAREWARLIAANIVLGRDVQAQAIYTEALDVFAGQPSALLLLDNAIVTERPVP